jgi:hypothetical protein
MEAIVGIIIIVVIAVALTATALVVIGSPINRSGGIGKGNAGSQSGYVVNCTAYYLENLPSSGNLTCSNATLINNVLKFQTTQDTGSYTAINFYLILGNLTLGNRNLKGFYLNATSPVNVTFNSGQVLTVTFNLTPSQVSLLNPTVQKALLNSTTQGFEAATVGWNWNNATSPGSGGGGVFATLFVTNSS